MDYMKAVVVTAPGQVEIREDVPKPVLGDYEALIRVHACGFCNGTDLQIIRGTGGDLGNGVSIYPTVLGHEGAGEVVAVGKKVRHIKVGERWIHPNLYPDVGNGYTKTHGSMAEYGMISDNQAMLEDGFTERDFPWVKQHRFPDWMSYEDAGVLLSLAESHSAARNFDAAPGKEFLIYGAGPMGLALALFCTLEGASVTQIDSHDDRLDRAKAIAKVGTVINRRTEDVDKLLEGKEFDVVVDCVGSTAILYEGSHRLKNKGIIGSVGVLKSDDRFVDTSKLKCNTRMQMLNFPVGEYALMDETIELIRTGAVNPKDFYSHVLDWEEIEQAAELVKTREALKVILSIYDSSR
ncbi:MAG: alcohol dehydrogenase catalytic domain-containing protein [Lachnospiraceae bacterium]|nr:alcohol dehydrogenase catalytic domain-containing protein [Lachnospiraceae bacterium]